MLDVIFGAGMTQIAWPARMVGSARCADRTPQRGVPTVVSTRIDFKSVQTMSLAGLGDWLKMDLRFFTSLRMTTRLWSLLQTGAA